MARFRSLVVSVVHTGIILWIVGVQVGGTLR
jgi:hypothetical protein